MGASVTPLVLGTKTYRQGDITTNNWVGARSGAALEASLGFGKGRLAEGWWILVLKQKLAPADFIFSGLTIRSGGREGLPAPTQAEDEARLHVHAALLNKYGADEVARMQRKALDRIQYQGPERLVKVVPVTPHSAALAPSEQYPMGGGGLQWTLRRPCEFLVAVQVDRDSVARAPSFSVFIGESAPYDNRHKLARYIEAA